MTSPPLSDILTTLNQNSDNMIAKTLNKALALTHMVLLEL